MLLHATSGGKTLVVYHIPLQELITLMFDHESINDLYYYYKIEESISHLASLFFALFHALVIHRDMFFINGVDSRS